MSYYEHTIIARPDVSPNQFKQIEEKYSKIVQENNGDILKIENWGLMNLSYLIKKNKKGNYLHFIKVKKIDTETNYFNKNDENDKKSI